MATLILYYHANLGLGRSDANSGGSIDLRSSITGKPTTLNFDQFTLRKGVAQSMTMLSE